MEPKTPQLVVAALKSRIKYLESCIKRATDLLRVSSMEEGAEDLTFWEESELESLALIAENVELAMKRGLFLEFFTRAYQNFGTVEDISMSDAERLASICGFEMNCNQSLLPPITPQTVAGIQNFAPHVNSSPVAAAPEFRQWLEWQLYWSKVPIETSGGFQVMNVTKAQMQYHLDFATESLRSELHTIVTPLGILQDNYFKYVRLLAAYTPVAAAQHLEGEDAIVAKGIVNTLAVAQSNPVVCDSIITDGSHATLIRIRDSKILVYLEVPISQAIAEVADVLKQHEEIYQKFGLDQDDKSRLPVELRVPSLNMEKALAQQTGLQQMGEVILSNAGKFRNKEIRLGDMLMAFLVPDSL